MYQKLNNSRNLLIKNQKSNLRNNNRQM